MSVISARIYSAGFPLLFQFAANLFRDFSPLAKFDRRFWIDLLNLIVSNPSTPSPIEHSSPWKMFKPYRSSSQMQNFAK